MALTKVHNRMVADAAVNVKDFGATGDGTTDDTAAIQAAINYAAARYAWSVDGTVFLPAGNYRITSSLDTTVASPVSQVGLRGEGQFATAIKPDGNFTAIKMRTAYVDSGDFSIEWPVTAAASISASRIGIEFAGPNNQFSYTTVENITVMYAYRGFVLLDNSGQPLGTTYLATLRKLTAFRCADYGFHLDSKNGSTTLVLEQCYVNASDSTGSAYGKGLFADNINDLTLQGCAFDLCLNSWLLSQNHLQMCAISTAFESCGMDSASATAVLLNGAVNTLTGVKVFGGTLDTSGNARIIFFGANAFYNTVSAYREQAITVAGGTTKYAIALSNAATQIFVSDQSAPYADILDNGFFANLTYGAQRYSRLNLAPNYGTWAQGDVVYNRTPSAAGKIGHVCVTAGSPGTWKPFGAIDA